MFKKLKEKVSTVTTELQSAHTRAQTTIQGLNTQATQYIDQLVNNASKEGSKDDSESDGKSETLGASGGDTAGDLLEFNDNDTTDEKSVPEKNDSSLDQFSLVELDDESPSNASPNSGPNAVTSNSSHSENDSFFSMTPITSPTNHFVPQSDIESEYESESHSRFPSVDNVSKEQLLELCIKLKERGKKYRDRWTQVVKGYRLLVEDKEKMKKVLVDTQDKALRRINELREQSNLEQQAKRHLEENLRLVIDEKDEKIKVLQTKIGLLKDNNGLNGVTDDLVDLGTDSMQKANELREMSEKVERLETLLTRCKESLKTNKER
ncbi:unnamed protein product, partial [Oppiella nova]